MNKCEECIEKIIRYSYTMYDATTARLKDKPLCKDGTQLYNGQYICQKIKGSYHRPKRKW